MYVDDRGNIILVGREALEDFSHRLRENRKLHYRTEFQGLPISVENRKGSIRRGEDQDGEEWETKHKVPYGYIRGTKGTDGDALDVFVGKDPDAAYAYVIHINNPETGEYDEDKVFLGFDDERSAVDCFRQHYDEPHKFYSGVDIIPMWKFRDKVFVKKETQQRLVASRRFAEGRKVSETHEEMEDNPSLEAVDTMPDPLKKKLRRIEEVGASLAGRGTDKDMRKSILGRHQDIMLDPQVREGGPGSGPHERLEKAGFKKIDHASYKTRGGGSVDIYSHPETGAERKVYTDSAGQSKLTDREGNQVEESSEGGPGSGPRSKDPLHDILDDAARSGGGKRTAIQEFYDKIKQQRQARQDALRKKQHEEETRESGVKGMHWGVKKGSPSVTVMMGTNGAGKSTVLKAFADRNSSKEQKIAGEKWSVASSGGKKAVLMGNYQGDDHTNASTYFIRGNFWDKLKGALSDAKDIGASTVIVDSKRLGSGKAHEKLIDYCRKNGILLQAVRVRAPLDVLMKRVAGRVESGHQRDRSESDLKSQHQRVKTAYDKLEGLPRLKLNNHATADPDKLAGRLGSFVFHKSSSKESLRESFGNLSMKGASSPLSIRTDSLHPTEAFGPKRKEVSDAEVSKAKRGKQRPILIKKRKSGGYHILDGHHRVLAAKQAGRKTIQARVRESQEHGVKGMKWGVRKDKPRTGKGMGAQARNAQSHRTAVTLRSIQQQREHLNQINQAHQQQAQQRAQQRQQPPSPQQSHSMALDMLKGLGWTAAGKLMGLTGMGSAFFTISSILRSPTGQKTILQTDGQGNHSFSQGTRARASESNSLDVRFGRFMRRLREGKSRVYYARSLQHYGSSRESDAVDALEEAYPDSRIDFPSKNKKHEKLGMGYFHKRIDKAKEVVITPFRRNRITAGVFSEVRHAQHQGIPVRIFRKGRFHTVKEVRQISGGKPSGEYAKVIFKRQRHRT